MKNQIIQGDCLQKLKELPDNSVDSVVTDPPYGLSFMGKKWDYDVPSTEIWEECLRVLKPGGYLLAFAGTRTQHRMAVRIEDAGFEIRDMIAWVYGSGFPKSLNIGKAVDKMEGTEYPKNTVVSENGSMSGANYTRNTIDVQSEVAKWEGWGTALKPALEPITVARKPLAEKTVAENVLKWGTGGINIDGCRVGTEEITVNRHSGYNSNSLVESTKGKWKGEQEQVSGRFPANLIHDGSDEVVDTFPNDSQRFFYCAKTSKSERNRGCEGLEEKSYTIKNNHPTVKPIALMEYLVKLVTKENAIVLDPFAGSGSTLLACKNLNRNYIGIEREADYIEIIKARLT